MIDFTELLNGALGVCLTLATMLIYHSAFKWLTHIMGEKKKQNALPPQPARTNRVIEKWKILFYRTNALLLIETLAGSILPTPVLTCMALYNTLSIWARFLRAKCATKNPMRGPIVDASMRHILTEQLKPFWQRISLYDCLLAISYTLPTVCMFLGSTMGLPTSILVLANRVMIASTILSAYQYYVGWPKNYDENLHLQKPKIQTGIGKHYKTQPTRPCFQGKGHRLGGNKVSSPLKEVCRAVLTF